MNVSSAYISCVMGSMTYTYKFTGVKSIEHCLTSNIGTEAKEGEDIINGTRNAPDKISLSVIESDVEHNSGWATRILEVLSSIKRRRILCGVYTSIGFYKDMLLTGITVTQDEENLYGWTGELVFQKYVPQKEGSAETKTSNNSSTRNNSGNQTAPTVDSTVFLQLLAEAGVST